MAGADRKSTAAPSRILADMESRRPAAGAAPAFRRKAGIFALALLGICLLLALVALGSRLLGPAEPELDGLAGEAPAPAPQTDGAAVPQGGAIIIDDPGAGENRDDAFAGIASVDSEAETAPDTAANRAGADANTAPARTQPRRTAARTPPARRAANEDDAPLLSTLLRIIKQEEAEPAGEDYESLDALVAQIQANDQAQAETSATLAALGGAPAAQPAPARSPTVQEQLRACPAANTPAGIDCRRKICARYAGEDGACPVQ